MTLKVLFAIPDGKHIGGCEAYRMMYPSHAIELLGAQCAVIPMNKLAEIAESRAELLMDFDLVVFQRMTCTREEDLLSLKMAIVSFRSRGMAVVVDYDDDYTNEHRHVVDGTFPQFDPFSAVTVSTPYLAGVMKRKGAHTVHVMPNGIVPEIMDGRQYHRVLKKLTVGLTGSKTHTVDWVPAEKALLELMEEGLPISVFVSGYIPESLKGKPGVVTMRDLVPEADRDDFFIPLESYGGIHANIDILLCPVDPGDKFNWSKSNLKAIEGMASRRDVGGKPGGSCVIATGGDLPIYQDAVIHEKTGLLISDHSSVEEWKGAIRKVAMNVEYRNKLQIAGYQLCMKRFDVMKLARKRLATYTELVSQAKKDSGKWEAELAQLEKTI